MKILTQNELDAANNVFLQNGAKGALGCFAASLSAVYLLPRYTRFGRSLTIPLKAFFISSATTVGFVIKGEHALIAYDREQHGIPKSLQSKLVPKQDLPLTQQFQNFVAKYRYYILFGAWAGGMTLAGLHLYKKKYLTTSQKLVEARMYAQAITLVSMGGVAAISAGASEDPKNERHH